MIAPFARLEPATPIPGVPPLAETDPLEALPADRRDGQSSKHTRTPRASAGDPPRPDGPQARPTGDLGRLLSLLADRTRLQILRILAAGERPVIALTSELRQPQPTVSHHLAWLRMMDLVAPRRQGKHIFYSLGPTAHCEADGTLTLRSREGTVTIRPRS